LKMNIEDRRFEMQKLEALHKLREAIKKGEVDENALEILNFINSLPDFYTTSSCSGRISLFVELGSKPENYWLGKWHREVSLDEILERLKKLPSKGVIWLRYEPSIFHIVAKSLEKAKKVLEIARSSGYKRAGIQVLKEGRFVVEIADTERIDVPIGENSKLFIQEDYLKHLVRFANEKFRKGSRKLKRLESNLMKELKDQN